MDVALPAPGGSVGIPKFAVYSVGAALGLVAYAHYGMNIIPDSWEEWSIGPVKGVHLWMGASALLGAALAAKLSQFGK